MSLSGLRLRESLFLKHLLRQRGPVLAAAVVMLAEAAVTVGMPLPIRFIMNHLLVPAKHGKAPCLSFLPWGDSRRGPDRAYTSTA